MKRPANAVEPQAALVVQAVLAVLKAAPDVTTVGYADLLLEVAAKFDEEQLLTHARPLLRALPDPADGSCSPFQLVLAGMMSEKRSRKNSECPAQISTQSPRDSPGESRGIGQVELLVTSGAQPDSDATWLRCPCCSFSQQSKDGIKLFVDHLARHRRNLHQEMSAAQIEQMEARLVGNKMAHKQLTRHLEEACATTKLR